MTTYKLEETPHVFISPYHNETYRYHMIILKEWPKFNKIRDINLNNDKLVIYGVEIKELILQKLYDSLRLDATATIFVNCNGECCIWVKDKGFFRSLHNVIFDWSPFGVIVPNSVNDILTKQLRQKDGLLEASKNETEELKEQLSSKESELQSLNSVLKSTKIELESSNKKLKEVEFQLLSTKKENQDIVEELQNEVSVTKNQLESYHKKITKVEEELSLLKEDELQSMKVLFEFTGIVKEVGDQCFGRESYVNKAVEIADE